MDAATMLQQMKDLAGYPTGGKISPAIGYRFLNHGQQMLLSLLPVDSKDRLVSNAAHSVATDGTAIPADCETILGFVPTGGGRYVRFRQEREAPNAWTVGTEDDPVLYLEEGKTRLEGASGAVAGTLRYYRQAADISDSQDCELDLELHPIVTYLAVLLWVETPGNSPGGAAKVPTWNEFGELFKLTLGVPVDKVWKQRPRKAE